MKMSIKRRFGMVQVAGGRILRVTRDHQVSVKGYDSRIDDIDRLLPSVPGAPAMCAFKRRTFEQGWETAVVGDLAIEVLNKKTSHVMAYAYLSGRAISIFRHVCDDDRELVASWFDAGTGLRFEVAPSIEPSTFTAAMIGLKYGGADIAACELRVADVHEAQYACAAFANAYSYGSDELEATTDVLIRCRLDRGKEDISAHFQATRRAQDYALQPFVGDLVLSSEHLAPVDFQTLKPPGLPQ